MIFHRDSSISDFICFDVTFPDLGSKSVSVVSKSATFSYPCSNSDICTPYTLNLSSGTYKFECWGAKGVSWGNIAAVGLGGYSSGIIHIHSQTTFYVYIGATGRFNSVNTQIISGHPGGGATDVRTDLSDDWYDIESLKSRIIVAGGGGGSEWTYSIGGNGGGLIGGISYSASHSTNPSLYPEPCFGGNQTHGGICPDYSSSIKGYPGSFGSAGSPLSSSDMGGYGGGGYYGGGSLDYAGAGSGGSSYISGYPGCNSVSNHSYISHTNSPFHFSGYNFQYSEMISGNTSMPLPDVSDGPEGIWSESHGKFRITLIGTCLNITIAHRYFIIHTIFIFQIMMIITNTIF